MLSKLPMDFCQIIFYNEFTSSTKRGENNEKQR